MISRWVRTWDSRLLAPLAARMGALGITPNALSLLGLLAEGAAGLLLALGHAGWGVAALLLGQVLDSLDGELARCTASSSAFGAFLDSICDHYGDLAVYLGLLWYYVQLGARAEPILIVVALFGSVFGSHVRSRAGVAGIDTQRVGFVTRFERTLVLVAGLLTGQLLIALWALAVFNNLSALQRIVYVLRVSQRGPELPRS